MGQTPNVSPMGILVVQVLSQGNLLLNGAVKRKKTKNKTFLLKVDFDEHFDSINWLFLDSVMSQIRFIVKREFWNMECLTSSRATTLLNGSTTNEIPIMKGVR